MDMAAVRGRTPGTGLNIEAMGGIFRSRRWIALIAAYVVALQAVLLPISAVAAAPIAASICSAHATSDRAPLPAEGQSGCPCAAGCGTLCCAHAVLAPEAAVIASGADVFGPALAPRLRPVGVVHAPDWPPQAARAPPRV
jgi:hypothetical protein